MARVRLRVRCRVRMSPTVTVYATTSPLYLPSISPLSPLYLPSISPLSPLYLQERRAMIRMRSESRRREQAGAHPNRP